MPPRWAGAQAFMRSLPPVYSFQVAKHPGANPDVQPFVQEHCALLPHEMFAMLADSSPETLDHLMTGPNLARWWHSADLAARDSPEGAEWLASARAATDNAEQACHLVRPLLAVMDVLEQLPAWPHPSLRGCASRHARR